MTPDAPRANPLQRRASPTPPGGVGGERPTTEGAGLSSPASSLAVWALGR